MTKQQSSIRPSKDTDIYAFRRPKQARGKEKFNQILDTADALILEMGVNSVSLYDIADRAEIAVGSVYHFFPGIQAVLVALIERYDVHFAKLVREPIEPDKVHSWPDVLYLQTENSRKYINNTPTAMILMFGPGQSWGTRLADAEGDHVIVASMIKAIEDLYQIPKSDLSTEIMLNALSMLEALWARSYMIHGHVSEEFANETHKAMVAYLSLYWPIDAPATDHEI